MSVNTRYQLSPLSSELAHELKVDKLPLIIDDSLALAFKSHHGQMRERFDERAEAVPYIVHPVGVAKLAARYIHSASLEDDRETVVATCLLHDVLEDSETSLTEIEHASSKRVATLVLALTKPNVVQTRSRSERNFLFMNQISDAGPTARFIKACDAAHNLSRPEAMPIRLLEKSIEKSAGYLELANIPQIGEKLLNELQQRVARARQTLAERRIRSDFSIPTDLEQAFSALDQKTSGKPLEVHDISELLVQMTGGLHVKIGPIDSLLRVSEDDRAASRRRTALLDKANKGWFSVEGQHLDMPNHLGTDARFLLVEAGNVFHSTDLFVLAVFGTTTAQWMGPATFRALVLRSFDRLRASQHQRWLDVHATISELGLILEPDLAVRTCLGISQLSSLGARLESAEFVRRNSVLAIERFIQDSRSHVHFDRLESRTKSAQSIVEKMAQRHIESFDDLDDLVGLRIIAASKKVINALAEGLLAALQEPTSDLARIINPITNTITDRAVASISGYSARHICFQAHSPSIKFSSIACELQLRTIHEDAWARVSHLLIYKSKKNISRTKSALRDLSLMRDGADQIINNL